MAIRRARFKHDFRGVGEMLRSSFIRREMYNKANQIKAVAEAIAPVDTGDYASAFEASSGVREDRAYGRVENTDPAALWIELGTSDTPRHRTLGKAAEQVVGGD